MLTNPLLSVAVRLHASRMEVLTVGDSVGKQTCAVGQTTYSSQLASYEEKTAFKYFSYKGKDFCREMFAYTIDRHGSYRK
jgi:hypothetical protein